MASSSTRTLSRVELNRAVLQRQLLLERSSMDVVAAVEQVGGLNGQLPNPPYVSLWSRLDRFERTDLYDRVEDRSIVRSPVLRGTQRLVTADDLRWMRPTLAAEFAKAQRGAFGRQLPGLDPLALAAYATELLLQRPRTGSELRQALVERFPACDRQALAYSAHYLVPTVALPPAAQWDNRGRLTHAHAEQWLGRPLDSEPDVRRLVLRYLAAFGHATPADLRIWSRVTGLNEVFGELRPSLRVFRDERGRELYDLPDAPLSDPARPAPTRFLPDLDDLLLAYDDRSRIMTDGVRKIVCVPDLAKACVLVDGMVSALWRVERDIDSVTLVIEPLTPGVVAAATDEIITEGERLLGFVAPEAVQRGVRFEERDDDMMPRT